MRQKRYIIGPNPYDLRSASNTEGNGHWEACAETMDEALEIIFGTMTCPGEATGRYQGAMIPNVSLNAPAGEVVQVWSTEPEAIAKLQVAKDRLEYMPHTGNGEDLGLALEIRVQDLHRWSHPEKKMLSAGDGTGHRQLSEIGANVTQFIENRLTLQLEIQHKRMDLAVAKWDMEEKQTVLRKQVQELNEKMFLAETYMHGNRGIVHIMRGERGTGPYHVFQERQFLNKEICLLANLTNFGFEQFEQLDAWLQTSGKIFKFLPFERTILVTRIRDKDKDYGDVWSNATLNPENYVSVIWVRDGKNVWRMPTSLDFQNAVFPDSHEEERIVSYVTERVYKEVFSKDGGYKSSFDRPEPPAGKLKPKAVKEEEPYATVFHGPRRHATLEEWKSSPSYTDKIHIEIAQAAGRYLVKHNKERMTFMLLLQGMVDNTDLLDIPKGTDLFDWKNCSVFFNLIQDYSHGLPDGHGRDLLAAAFRLDQVRAGDMLLVNSQPWDSKHCKEHCGYRSWNIWHFYTVVGRAEGLPLVVHHYPHRHYPHGRLKKSTRLAVDEKMDFIRLSMPKSLVNAALDNREWKTEHLRLVPVLAQWDYVLEQAAVAKNCTRLRTKGPDGEVYADD